LKKTDIILFNIKFYNYFDLSAVFRTVSLTAKMFRYFLYFSLPDVENF